MLQYDLMPTKIQIQLDSALTYKECGFISDICHGNRSCGEECIKTGVAFQARRRVDACTIICFESKILKIDVFLIKTVVNS